jgi:hypothetical protein
MTKPLLMLAVAFSAFVIGAGIGSQASSQPERHVPCAKVQKR